MKQLVLDFAVSELKRLQAISDDSKNIKLLLNNAMVVDSYRLDMKSSEGVIEAGNERGLLYGVYTYAKTSLGMNFDRIGFEEMGTPTSYQEETYVPRFTRRGNIFEVINDTEYLLKQIDHNAKHGHNEMFFTFFLYDEVKDEIKSALQKRDFKVTLGGHSLKWLIEPILELAKNEDDNLSFYKDEKLMMYIIERIVKMCKEDELISRISLWPQDIGIPESRGQEFMQLYIDFNVQLKKHLRKENLDVAVEFIVYNAGLNWEMLDYYDVITVDEDLDILYAYWGRDYSQPLNVTRAVEALQSWLKVSEVTVLEYYSDFFMLSELYPPLTNRIGLDATMYEELGVKGLLNLVVPLLQSRTSNHYAAKYDYKMYHQMNNNVYSEAVWHPTDYDISDLEAKLAAVTRYNRPYFPKRLVDLELDETMKNELIEINKLLTSDDRYQTMIREVIETMLYE